MNEPCTQEVINQRSIKTPRTETNFYCLQQNPVDLILKTKSVLIQIKINHKFFGFYHSKQWDKAVPLSKQLKNSSIDRQKINGTSAYRNKKF
jgi:hypothetical protein